MSEVSGHTLAIFASENGPGDAERASIMSQVGSFLAKKGARLVCSASGDGLCIPLINSAVAAGGEVLIVSCPQSEVPEALSGIKVERFDTKEAEQRRISEIADALVGLPGSLRSVTSLYETWLQSDGKLPVTLLNRNRAYEVMRGFAVDVLSHSLKDWENSLQIADNVDDMWNRLTRTFAARP